VRGNTEYEGIEHNRGEECGNFGGGGMARGVYENVSIENNF